MEKINSIQNNRVKAWTSLQTKKGRDKNKTYLLDGWHLIEEAIKNNGKIHTIFGSEEQLSKYSEYWNNSIPTFEINDSIIKKISTLNNPQGIFAEVSLNRVERIPKYIHKGSWVFLDGIQDPGNIGTIIRTADAAGYTGVVCSNDTVDIYSPKVVRAMQGSQFHIPVTYGDLKEWIYQFKDNSIPVYGTKVDKEAVDLFTLEPQQDFAIIMGNEGNGLNKELVDMTDQNLYIPIVGKAESLNVAVAAGVSMFHLKER